MGLCDLRNFFPPLKHCPRYLSPKPPLSERGLAVDLPVSNIWSFAVAKVKFINYALLGTKIIMKIPLCNFHNEFCIIFKKTTRPTEERNYGNPVYPGQSLMLAGDSDIRYRGFA